MIHNTNQAPCCSSNSKPLPSLCHGQNASLVRANQPIANMNTQQMEQMGQFKITVWEEENFQGKRCEFMLECQNIMERGFNKIRSMKVENGP